MPPSPAIPSLTPPPPQHVSSHARILNRPKSCEIARNRSVLLRLAVVVASSFFLDSNVSRCCIGMRCSHVCRAARVACTSFSSFPPIPQPFSLSSLPCRAPGPAVSRQAQPSPPMPVGAARPHPRDRARRLGPCEAHSHPPANHTRACPPLALCRPRTSTTPPSLPLSPPPAIITSPTHARTRPVSAPLVPPSLHHTPPPPPTSSVLLVVHPLALVHVAAGVLERSCPRARGHAPSGPRGVPSLRRRGVPPSFPHSNPPHPLPGFADS